MKLKVLSRTERRWPEAIPEKANQQNMRLLSEIVYFFASGWFKEFEKSIRKLAEKVRRKQGNYDSIKYGVRCEVPHEREMWSAKKKHEKKKMARTKVLETTTIKDMELASCILFL